MLKPLKVKKFFLIFPIEFEKEFYKKLLNLDYIHLIESDNKSENVFQGILEKAIYLKEVFNLEISKYKKVSKISFRFIEKKLDKIIREFNELQKVLKEEKIIEIYHKFKIKNELIGEHKFFTCLLGYANKSILQEKSFYIKLLEEGRDKVLVIILFLNEEKESVEKILKSYDFEEIKTEFNKEILEKAKVKFEKLKLEAIKVLRLLGNLSFLRLQNFSSKSKLLTFINGWIIERKISEFEIFLNRNLNKYYVFFKDPEKGEKVPFINYYPYPFNYLSTLTKIIGIPSYYEIDPTAIFSIIYVLMFGMMFGDLGFGVVYILLGIFIRKYSKVFSTFLIFCGISSAIFGFIYGDLFLKEFKEPIIHPIKNMFTLIKISIYFGISQIVLGLILNIYNKFYQGHNKEALYSSKGLFGLTFFIIFVLFAFDFINNNFTFSKVSLFYLFFLSVLFSIVLMKNNFSEAIELIFSYFSNLVSYVRIAAFSISHAALAFLYHAFPGFLPYLISVFLAFLIGSFSSFIQSLRLLFYEFSTKFYEGSGYEFKPISRLKKLF